MKKRIFGLVAATAFTLAAIAVPVAAFEPPADPNDKFDGVAGFPGKRGQDVAMANGGLGAWNAHFHADPIDN